MFCRYCGNEIPEKAAYCPNCGAKTEGGILSSESSSAATITYPPILEPQLTTRNFLKHHCSGKLKKLVYGAFFACVPVFGVILILMMLSWLRAGYFYAGLAPYVDTLIILLAVAGFSCLTLHQAPGIIGTVLAVILTVVSYANSGETSATILALVWIVAMMLALARLNRDKRLYREGNLGYTAETPAPESAEGKPKITFSKAWLIVLCIGVVIVGTITAGLCISYFSKDDSERFNKGEWLGETYQNEYAAFKLSTPDGWTMDTFEDVQDENQDYYGVFYNPANTSLLISASSSNYSPLQGSAAVYLEKVTIDADEYLNQELEAVKASAEDYGYTVESSLSDYTLYPQGYKLDFRMMTIQFEYDDGYTCTNYYLCRQIDGRYTELILISALDESGFKEILSYFSFSE